MSLGELWDCQLGNLTAGKSSGGGGNGLSMVELGCRVKELSRQQMTAAAHRGTDSAEDIADSEQTPARNPAHLMKMPPRKTPKTRTTPATTTTPTTSVTDEQLKRLIAQGVADVLAEREATRSENGEDSHDSGMGGRRL
ncbi:hypothetical protein Tco_1285500 [Tanacetum coccineum]